jgi:hypothetical protein
MESWMTQDKVRRGDLEALKVNAPVGYIGGRIYPVRMTMEKAGDFTVQQVVSDVAAQTGRSEGATVTRTAVAMANIAYSCAERISGWSIGKNEMGQYGSIERADQVGGMMAKRSVLRSHEAAAATALYSTARKNAAIVALTGNLIAAFQEAAAAVKRCSGNTALVIGQTLFNQLVGTDEVRDRLGAGNFAAMLGLMASSQLSRDPAMVAQLLQSVFPFSEIIVGDDDHWRISGAENLAAVVKLPPTEDFAEKMGPTLGQTMCYWPQSLTAENGVLIPCEIESWVDADLKRNVYDGTAFYNIYENNATAAKLVNIGVDMPTTTTTTTTTT